jgi:predicted HTH transcriptional regulator
MGFKRISVTEDLMRIKDMIGHPAKRAHYQTVDEIIVQIKELNEKVNDIEKKLKLKKSNSPMILKRKKQIVFLLKQNKALSPAKLGELLNISRTRANEYLKEMEEEGIVKGFSNGRRKFYALVEQFAK